MIGVCEWTAMCLAETALRTSGGFSVMLRLPGLPAAVGDAAQMGLGTPGLQDVPVGPAVWRKDGQDTVLLLGGAAVAQMVGTDAFASAEVLFETAVGVVVSGVLYAITRSVAIVAGGVACAYRLEVAAPARA